MSLQRHTELNPGLLAIILVCLACTRVPRSEAPVVSAPVANESGQYISAVPEGMPVTVKTPSGETFDGFIDSLGNVFPAGVDFDDDVSDLHHGLFVMGPKGNRNIYSPLQPGGIPLNSVPFSSLTDFRMGVAYGTRPGRGVMVVGTNGVVSRLLSDRIRSVSLNGPGSETVAVTTPDLPLTGRLTTTGEELFKVPDSVPFPVSVTPDFWPSLELVTLNNGYSRVFSRANGRSVGDFLVRPVRTGGRFKSVTTDHINPAEASSIISGITSSGWEIDSTFYSASTPGWLIVEKSGLNPLRVAVSFSYLDQPVISIPRGKGLGSLYFTFTAPPYSMSDESGFMSWFRLPRRDNASRVRTITMPVTVENGLERPMMKAAESLIMQKGFIGLADRSHAFQGKGNTYLYFVPNDRGFFIVMSFGELDYPTLMGSAMTQPSNYKNNHINISL